MKFLIVALAFAAMAHAYDVQDIPAHMRDRLDRYIAMKKQWNEKWAAMDDQQQKTYEEVLLGRISNLPEIEHQRIYDRIASMPDDHRHKLRDYLRRRFPQNAPEEEVDEVEEIDGIIQSLPEILREKITNVISANFQEATAYNVEDAEEIVDDEMNFPDIPEIIDIPDTTGYSEQVTDDLRTRLDEFLLKREDWKRKWEHLSDEKKAVFEQYIKDRMAE